MHQSGRKKIVLLKGGVPYLNHGFESWGVGVNCCFITCICLFNTFVYYPKKEEDNECHMLYIYTLEELQLIIFHD